MCRGSPGVIMTAEWRPAQACQALGPLTSASSVCLPRLWEGPVREQGWEPAALCPPTASSPPHIGQLLVK